MDLPWRWPTLIGHRGLAGMAPENTQPAFAAAIARGLSWVELDAKLCASGEVVVFHDNRVERTSNGHGRVQDLTFKQLRALDAGAWLDKGWKGTQIPTLDEVLHLCAQHQIGVNIELKANPDQYSATARAVAGVISNGHYAAQSPLLISSFSRQSLHSAKLCMPHLPRALLQDKTLATDTLLHYLTELDCVSCHLDIELCTPVLLHTLKARGYGVLVYTVNDEVVAKDCLARGINAVFSDFPLQLN